eukprot:m.436620 g.436620  ORF g.436620 m.436620 type:complete len:1788 (+) comp17999_c0_seq1:238-5601(+)
MTGLRFFLYPILIHTVVGAGSSQPGSTTVPNWPIRRDPTAWATTPFGGAARPLPTQAGVATPADLSTTQTLPRGPLGGAGQGAGDSPTRPQHSEGLREARQVQGACVGACGSFSFIGNCWCNSDCVRFGDCCADVISSCTPPPPSTAAPTTATPTTAPPTAIPTMTPSESPTAGPTTTAPTAVPTTAPTGNPSAAPTTNGPTVRPTAAPTGSPTAPTAFPTAAPTGSPTIDHCAGLSDALFCAPLAQTGGLDCDQQYDRLTCPVSCGACNVCAENTCLNGATCESLLGNSSLHVSALGPGYRCVCPTGYFGARCEVGPQTCYGQSDATYCEGHRRQLASTGVDACADPSTVAQCPAMCNACNPCVTATCPQNSTCVPNRSADAVDSGSGLDNSADSGSADDDYYSLTNSSASDFTCECQAAWAGDSCQDDPTCNGLTDPAFCRALFLNYPNGACTNSDIVRTCPTMCGRCDPCAQSPCPSDTSCVPVELSSHHFSRTCVPHTGAPTTPTASPTFAPTGAPTAPTGAPTPVAAICNDVSDLSFCAGIAAADLPSFCGTQGALTVCAARCGACDPCTHHRCSNGGTCAPALPSGVIGGGLGYTCTCPLIHLGPFCTDSTLAPTKGTPTGAPTSPPTGNPTNTPSHQPSNAPSSSPTGRPTPRPTATPSTNPSASPTQPDNEGSGESGSGSDSGSGSGFDDDRAEATAAPTPSRAPSKPAVTTLSPTLPPTSVAPSTAPPTSAAPTAPRLCNGVADPGACTTLVAELNCTATVAFVCPAGCDACTSAPSTSAPSSAAPTAQTQSPTLAPTAIPTAFPTPVCPYGPDPAECRTLVEATGCGVIVSGVCPAHCNTCTDAPTSEPTFAPTTSPTSAPTTISPTQPDPCSQEDPIGCDGVSVMVGCAPAVVNLCPRICGRCPGFTTRAPASAAPTSAPTAAPTDRPSARPTESPTAGPTASPTERPSAQPTHSPTSQPTTVPSAHPTPACGHGPDPDDCRRVVEELGCGGAVTAACPAHCDACTVSPTATPTAMPSESPTSAPSTAQPTFAPSVPGQSIGLEVVFGNVDLRSFAASEQTAIADATTAGVLGALGAPQSAINGVSIYSGSIVVGICFHSGAGVDLAGLSALAQGVTDGTPPFVVNTTLNGAPITLVPSGGGASSTCLATSTTQTTSTTSATLTTVTSTTVTQTSTTATVTTSTTTASSTTGTTVGPTTAPTLRPTIDILDNGDVNTNLASGRSNQRGSDRKMHFVTLMGAGAAMFFLLAYLGLYGLFSRARTSSKVASLNYALTTVVALAMLLLISSEKRPPTTCRVGLLALQFTVLASLCWTLVDLLQLRATFEELFGLDDEAAVARHRESGWVLGLAAYGVPALVTGLTAAFDYWSLVDDSVRDICSVSDTGVQYAFFVPGATVLLLILGAVLAVRQFDSATAARMAKHGVPFSKPLRHATQDAVLVTGVVALLICGGWTCGVLALYEQSNTDTWFLLHCAFAVCHLIAAILLFVYKALFDRILRAEMHRCVGLGPPVTEDTATHNQPRAAWSAAPTTAPALAPDELFIEESWPHEKESHSERPNSMHWDTIESEHLAMQSGRRASTASSLDYIEPAVHHPHAPMLRAASDLDSPASSLLGSRYVDEGDTDDNDDDVFLSVAMGDGGRGLAGGTTKQKMAMAAMEMTQSLQQMQRGIVLMVEGSVERRASLASGPRSPTGSFTESPARPRSVGRRAPRPARTTVNAGYVIPTSRLASDTSRTQINPNYLSPTEATAVTPPRRRDLGDPLSTPPRAPSPEVTQF